jgi:hypothetical protein
MLRRVRCIALALACSVLMAASSHAVPVKALPREPALLSESVAGTWEWLVSFLWKTPAVKPGPESKTAEDGSLLDPNGGHH